VPSAWFIGKRTIWRVASSYSAPSGSMTRWMFLPEVMSQLATSVWELAADERGLLYILAICLALAIRIAQLARGLELAERAKLPPPTAAPPELSGCEALTGREMAVLLEIAGGAKTTTIATRLSISARAVEAHLTAIYGKLQVSSRAHAVARAHYLGLLSATGSAP
jgi:ATP/maltotriose-dependent transcriptional regulator MalT